MLKILRHKNISKIIFWALVILVLPAFVLWGTGSPGRGGGPTHVGKIDNKKVSFEDFHSAVVGTRVQIILNYFDNQKMLDAFLKNRSFLGRLAWDRLILESEAKKSGIKVSNADVITYITKTNPIFTRDGRFDEQVYEYVLRNNMGLEPRSFEEIVRQNLAIQRLNDAIARGITVTDGEVMEAFKRDNQRFKAAYIYFPAADFASGVDVTDAQIQEYYEKRKNELMIPVKDASGKETMRAASFDDAKGDIAAYLAEAGGHEIAARRAGEERDKIVGLMAKGVSFNDAAAGLGLKAPVETPFFSKGDYLEGIGEGERLAAEAAKLEKGGLSGAVVTRKGAVIFTLIDTEPFDREKFENEKALYAEKALEEKKTKFREDWLRQLEKKTTLNINLDDYQQYYR